MIEFKFRIFFHCLKNSILKIYLPCHLSDFMGLTGKIKRSLKNPKKTINRTYHKVDGAIGKKVYGNTVGFKMNFVGSRGFNNNSNENLQRNNPMIYELLQNQVLFLDKPYNPEFIEKIISKYHKLLDNDQIAVNTQGYGDEVYCRHIKNPEKNFPEIKELLNDKIKKDIFDYYGNYFYIKNVVCHRNYHIPDEYASTEFFSNTWHCDRRNTSEMKLFVYLSDVTIDDGPFHFQPLEQTKKLMRDGFGTRENYNIPLEIIEDSNLMQRPIGSKGTAFFANVTQLLHRAGIPSKNHYRDIIQFTINPSDKPLSENWLKDVVPLTFTEYDKNHSLSS